MAEAGLRATITAFLKSVTWDWETTHKIGQEKYFSGKVCTFPNQWHKHEQNNYSIWWKILSVFWRYQEDCPLEQCVHKVGVNHTQ